MSGSLPSSESIDSLLAKIEALMGLSAKFPARRGEIKVEDPRDRERYERLWAEVDADEAQRELRESALRTNELFIIRAFRPDTAPFRSIAESAAPAVGLTPIVMDEQEPEDAISEATLSSIRRSTLVLCDLSFERPNCYFEAGFAK